MFRNSPNFQNEGKTDYNFYPKKILLVNPLFLNNVVVVSLKKKIIEWRQFETMKAEFIYYIC
jgi:hypothetical protein